LSQKEQFIMQRIITKFLQGAIVMGLAVTAGKASANGCPGGTYYVTTNNDSSRVYAMRAGTNDMIFGQDLSTNCAGSVIGYRIAGTSTSVVDNLNVFSYLGAGNYTFAGGVSYNAIARIDGSLTAFYTTNNTQYFFIAQRNVTPRRITINNQESRSLSNVQVFIESYIGGNKHLDWENVGSFTARYGLGAIMMNGTWDGAEMVGDFLYTEFTTSALPQKQVVIGKLDSRPMNSVRIHVRATISGQQFYDYEDVGDWNDSSVAVRVLTFNTGGVSSSFNGTENVGNFLR
jgi:hypothetical protein